MRELFVTRGFAAWLQHRHGAPRWKSFVIVQVLAIIAGAGSLHAQESALPASVPVVLTLAEALDLASGGNKQVQITTLDIVKAREGLAQAKTGFLPQTRAYAIPGYELDRVSFTIPVGIFGVYPATGPIPGKPVVSTPAQFAAYIYAYAAQPVTQLYKANLGVKEARLGVILAQESVRARKQEVRSQVREAYAELAQLQAAIDSAKAAVNYLSELAALTDRHLKEEAVLRSDAMIVHARLKAQTAELLTLEDSLKLSKEAFNRLLGRDLRTEFAIASEPEPQWSEIDLEAARQTALEQRPELREARLQTQIAALDVRREKAEYLPNISVQLSYWGFQNVAFLPQNVASAGIAFDWQPLDFGFKKHRMQELRATESQKRLGQEDVEQSILFDVDARHHKVNETRALMDADNEMAGAERQKLQEMTRQYEQRAIVLSELLQQQSAVAQADARYQESLAAYWTAKAKFQQALGEE